MNKSIFILACTCVAGITGCQSFSSTMLNRLGDNSFIGNSNGSSTLTSAARPFKGIPITLRVPSHLDVYIEEVFYLQDDGADKATVTEALAGTRILNVHTELIKTKKVFTVDYKRPGAGILNLNTTFSDEQYFKSIQESLSDTTIADSAGLVNAILGGTGSVTPTSTAAPPLFPPTSPVTATYHNPPAVPASGPTTDQAAMMRNLVRDSRIVAYRRFDINDPDYEMQVDAFVSQHLNNCDQCGQSPSYDDH